MLQTQHIYREGKHIASLIADRLYKFGLNENKHLLWSMGGVPCIDKKVWDDHRERIQEIVILTNKSRTFRINGYRFDTLKKEIDFGYGKQYTVAHEYWEISEKPNTEEKQKTFDEMVEAVKEAGL